MDLDETLAAASPHTTARDEMVRREVVALGVTARRAATAHRPRRRWGGRLVLGVSASALALGGAGAAAAAGLGSIGANHEQRVEVVVPNSEELVEVGTTDDGEGTVYESGDYTIIKRSESGVVTVEIYDSQTLHAKDAENE